MQKQTENRLMDTGRGEERVFFFEFTNQVLSKISLLNVIQVKKEKKRFCKMIISMD